MPVAAAWFRTGAATGGAAGHSEAWPAQATPEGEDHPILSAGPEADGGDFGVGLPPLYWALPVDEVKPGATVLLRYADPAMRDRHGRSAVLVAVQPYGLGRVFYCGSPGTWRWRRAGAGRFDRFWLQALRYCASERLAAGDRRPRISFERPTARLGKEVRVEARLLDADGRPRRDEAVALTLRHEGIPAGTVELRRSGAAGSYAGGLRPCDLGRYELAYAGADGAPLTAALDVRAPDVELRDLRMDLRTMERLAAETGGRLWGPGDVGGLPGAIEDRSRTTLRRGPARPLWDRAWLLGLLLAAVAAEWALRNAVGLL
jgi:hypothetical protein